MKKVLNPLVLIILITILLSCNTNNKKSDSNRDSISQSALDSLTYRLNEIKKNTLIPGFTATIVQGNDLVYSKGFGYSDIANKHKFTPQTVHTLASVSKTFIGVAIMKLVEDGTLKLEDPVNKFLPFTITSPHFPETDITIKHLVTHTSSLNDDFDDGEKRPSQLLEQSKYGKDEMPKELAGDIYYWDGTFVPLEKYVEEVFTPNGKWYDESNFSNFEPGEKYEYSNEGSNLAALIVERVSGMLFEDFTQKHIFQPLNMTQTYWTYKDLDAAVSKLYTTYEEEKPNEVFEFPRAKDSGQPCGHLKSNGDDLSKYIIEMMNGFKGEGTLLNAASYNVLLNPQLSGSKFEERDVSESPFNDDYDVGVFWAISKPGYRLHKGGSIGVFSLIYFNPANDIGVVSYCNLAHPDFGEIVNTIKEFEENIKASR